MTVTPSLRGSVFIAVALFAVLVPFYVLDVARTFHIDFVAFWCAGQATLAHQNPYLEGSIHACETSHGLIESLTVPVPYPPYAMALFALLALVPEPFAYALWCAMTLAAAWLVAWALCRLTGLPLVLTGATALLLVIADSLPLGQAAPIAACGFTLAVYFVREDRPVAAAIALAFAAIAPVFAAAAWIAAFVRVPRARVPLAAAAFVLAGIALLTTGPQTASQYFGAVLPAHGRSELNAFWQLGSVAVLHAAGVAEPAIAPIAYALLGIAIAAGIATGIALSRRYGGDHWVLACATAFAVAGAPFAHGADVAFALPVALMLFAQRPATLAAVALVFVATPWQHLVQDGGIQAAFVIAPLLVVSDAVVGSQMVLAVAIACTISAGTLAAYKLADAGKTQLVAAASLTRVPPPESIAEARWQAFADASVNPSAAWLSRVPTCVASLVLVAAAVQSARRKPIAKSPRLARRGGTSAPYRAKNPRDLCRATVTWRADRWLR